ncbi:hypothetical protein CTI12_AA110870 [Artemisia annua]|uniref:Uncharacterized protein n=1 Tax=Artemisia annua TaxID=35608 RepID=A0A2U1PUJ0_ARTAN|nr:hypothetical protein CTI12_AA110870 [Artemisia annua]
MASTNSLVLSSPPSTTNNLQQWLNNFIKTFYNHLHLNTNLPICIFQLPQTLTTQKPNSYTPQHIGLGPIHHFETNLYTNQQQLKLITSKTILAPFINTSQFDTIVQDHLVGIVPLARCCYDVYFDINDECLAWVLAIDALYLLDIMSKVTNGLPYKSFEDVFMVENQIPLVILVELLNALHLELNGDIDSSNLSSLLVKFCETRSPLKITTQETQLDLDVCNMFHLLDCMYHLIVNYRLPPKNPFLRTNFLMDVHLEDVENVVQIAGGLFPGANAILQPIKLILKLPWDKISVLVKKTLGENDTMMEINIPSVSKLSKIGKIEFSSTPGGIHDIKFDEGNLTFFLPVLELKSDSEVILRNLVAYEELMFKKETFTNLDFTEYVDLLCGIVDGVKDVKILREKNVIEGDMSDEEIVKLFNGITKSSVKNDGKTSELQKTISKVNTYYSNIPRVKAFNFIKKLFLATWKILAIVFSVMSLVLMVVTGVCEVYDCKGQFGLGNARFIFGYATGNNELTDF